MQKIIVINRDTNKEEEEKIFGLKGLVFLYDKKGIFFRFLRTLCLYITAKNVLFSKFYGFLQKTKASKKKIQPFIENFDVDANEFVKNPKNFTSFNDFFIRKLKPECRMVISDEQKATLPADGRYLVFPNIQEANGFLVKGEKFSLKEFLQDEELAKKYEKGAMVIARLCPIDYHRFHFPCDCTPTQEKLINGYLYSVNPLAVKKNIKIYAQNKRFITHLESKIFGKVLFIEVGATCVGTVKQTYTPNTFCKKGDEKGYFSFGGSSIVMLFEEKKILFDEDLVKNSENKKETKAQFGQSLGTSFIK